MSHWGLEPLKASASLRTPGGLEVLKLSTRQHSRQAEQPGLQGVPGSWILVVEAAVQHCDLGRRQGSSVRVRQCPRLAAPVSREYRASRHQDFRVLSPAPTA